MALTDKDYTQTLRYAFDDDSNAFRVTGKLVPENYDRVDLTYVAAGDGIGEIATATYYLDGVIVALLTMTYDVSDRLSSVARA